MMPCVLPIFVIELLALSLYLEKNRTKKQFVFENFSSNRCSKTKLSRRDCGKNSRISRGTRIATLRGRMKFNRHLFPMEGSYGIV
jgi:hypothetical protein